MSRRCGDCTACCIALGVVALDKPAFTDCANCRAARPAGCRVYETRPEECRSFECGWLSGAGANADRPDRSGVVLSIVRSKSLGQPMVQVHEVRPGAAAQPRGRALIDAALARSLIVVVLRADGTRSLFGPPEAVERIRALMVEAGGTAESLGWTNAPKAPR